MNSMTSAIDTMMTMALNGLSYFKCMKNRRTSEALNTAMPSAIQRLNRPKSSHDTATVTNVITRSVPSTANSTGSGTTCPTRGCAVCDMRRTFSADQIEQREQEDPDQVDEVPVQPHEVDRREVLRAEMPLDRADQDPRDRPHAGEHVQPVQPGHQEVDPEEDLHVARPLSMRGTTALRRLRRTHGTARTLRRSGGR